MINQEINELNEKGWVRLSDFKLDIKLKERLLRENDIDHKVYKENSKLSLDYLKATKLDRHLKNLLKEFLPESHNLTNPDFYNICRVVSSSDGKESFRAHFDSHTFTVVSPIQIPLFEENQLMQGQLILFPNLRREPKNEIINFIQKFLFKIFANKIGFLILKQFFYYEIFDFKDKTPILFLGRRSLHFNMPFKKSNLPRITLLTHVYDPSGKSGIGSILRKIRNR